MTKRVASGARGAFPAKAPEANFDRVARVYRWGEYLALGPLLKRTRESFLPELLRARQALVLGDGDGRFLARLLQRQPQLQAEAVDSSAAMLQLLADRCARAGAANRLRTYRTSISPAALSGLLHIRNVDLIVTHFFIDCLTQAEADALAKGIGARVAPGCLWVLSEFGLPERPALRWVAKLYIRGLYLAFRLLTGLRVQRLPDPGHALEAAGFKRMERRERLAGLLYSELWRRGPAVEPGVTIAARATSSQAPPSTPK